MPKQEKTIISYIEDKKFLDLFLECKVALHHFEPDPTLYQYLKHKLENSVNVTFYSNTLACKEQTKTYERGSGSCGIHPSIYYNSHHIYEAKSLKIDEILKKFSNLYLVMLDLNFETYEILEWLLESGEYTKISYIFCKVDAIFNESEKFKDLKQKIENISPPNNIVFY